MSPGKGGDLQPADGGKADAGVLPRELDARRAVIILMIAGMILAVTGSLFWLDWSGTAEGVIGKPTAAGAGQPILELDQILDEPTPTNLVGRVVSLWNVPVEQVAGDYLFWVGNGASRVAVVLLGELAGRQPESETRVRAGDGVAVFGIVRPIHDMRILDKPRAMSEGEWRELASHRVYISALRVDVLARKTTPSRLPPP